MVHSEKAKHHLPYKQQQHFHLLTKLVTNRNTYTCILMSSGHNRENFKKTKIMEKLLNGLLLIKRMLILSCVIYRCADE